LDKEIQAKQEQKETMETQRNNSKATLNATQRIIQSYDNNELEKLSNIDFSKEIKKLQKELEDAEEKLKETESTYNEVFEQLTPQQLDICDTLAECAEITEMYDTYLNKFKKSLDQARKHIQPQKTKQQRGPKEMSTATNIILNSPENQQKSKKDEKIEQLERQVANLQRQVKLLKQNLNEKNAGLLEKTSPLRLANPELKQNSSLNKSNIDKQPHQENTVKINNNFGQFSEFSLFRTPNKHNNWYSDNDIDTLINYYLTANSNDSIDLFAPILGTNRIISNNKEAECRNHLQEQLEAYLHEKLKHISQSAQSKVNDKLLIPVNLNQNHWTLLYIMAYKDAATPPKVYYFDSRGAEIPDDLAGALEAVFPQAKINNVGHPIQKGGDDCGPWIVEAARTIIEQDSQGKTLKESAILASKPNIDEAKQEHQAILDTYHANADQGKKLHSLSPSLTK
jgi:myosin heavy subunit